MSVPVFDSNNKYAFVRYQTQAKMVGRRHGFEKVLTGEQTDIYVMADRFNMWGSRGQIWT